MNSQKFAGYLCVIWSVIFVHLETRFFGSNWFPESNQELIWDGVCMAVNFIGIFLIFKKSKP